MQLQKIKDYRNTVYGFRNDYGFDAGDVSSYDPVNVTAGVEIP